MACDLETTQAAACESGIGKVGSPISLLQLIAQLSCEIADAGGGGGTPSAPLNSVQFNNAGAFGGSADLTFNDATNVLSLGGNLSIGGHILFAPDNTFDIGAAGANRPRTVYASATVVAGGQVQTFSGFRHEPFGGFNMSADGVMFLLNNAATGFDRVQFGGTTAAFPAIKRSATLLQARLADDSNFTEFECSNIITNNAAAAVSTNTTLTDNAGGGAGTLTNAPSAGDPTKWIAIDDNGTPRFIPTWT